MVAIYSVHRSAVSSCCSISFDKSFIVKFWSEDCCSRSLHDIGILFNLQNILGHFFNYLSE